MNASSHVRESRLLEHATRPRPLPGHISVPSGDDLAGIVTSGAVLTGVDQLVAGRHFDPATATLEEIGWKAVARCVSDIAAMALKGWGDIVQTAIGALIDGCGS